MSKITFKTNEKVVSVELTKISDSIQKRVKASIRSNAEAIEADAKARVDSDTGLLQRSIHTVYMEQGWIAVVGTPKKYGAYREFGTRKGVNVPTGWDSVAIKFRGHGGMTTGEHLRLWAKRHGLAGLEWAIAMHINKYGTKAKPYLIPAFKIGNQKFSEDLLKILKTPKG